MNAGITDTLSSPNLLLSLEPEGASIQCREDSEENIKNSLTKNKIVMVLDCGGGTVDITVHKLMCEPTESFLCEEFLPSSGGCEWGSKYVDAHFEKFLEEFFGEELYSAYLKNALGRLEILKHFEMLKRKFNPGKDERSRLQLSYLGEDLSSGQLKTLIDEWNGKYGDAEPAEGDPYGGVQLKKRGASGVDLPPQLMKSFFEPLFQKITDKVSELMQDAGEKKGEPIDFIFMVGGFSESPFLKSVIKDQFEREDLHILVPRRPQVSVIRGACMFGLNPRSITSRISKKTYGINTLTTFDPQKHPEEKKVIIEGEEF
jgi:molecular chaperone DnaK (HSP70)